jgi:hypothetical protein
MNNSDLHRILQGAINKKVLKVNAGGTGSIFSLDIGNKLVKKERGGQVFLEGEFVIMVYCSWRLFDKRTQKPITGWHENSDEGGSMTVGLKSLFDDIVEEVLLTSFHDMVIIFKSWKVLSVFCDLTPNVDADTNWFFGAQEKYYSVNSSLELIAE